MFEFPGPSVPTNYTGWSKTHGVANVPPGKRVVQEGINPVSTFGNALTRHGVRKVLEWAGKGKSGTCVDIFSPEIEKRTITSNRLGIRKFNSRFQNDNTNEFDNKGTCDSS